ncbi:MAG: hypothetical protein ACXQTM_01110 [Methanosarcinales archaeon]
MGAAYHTAPGVNRHNPPNDPLRLEFELRQYTCSTVHCSEHAAPL